MSIPTNAKASFAQTRIEQAYAAAEAGEGWLNLGRLWNVTNSAAMQWCQSRIPADIYAKIGRNGQDQKSTTKGRRRYEHSKPKVHVYVSAPGAHFDTCQYMRLDAGKLSKCGKPSDGKAHCEGCRRQLLTQPAGSNYRNHALIGVVSR